MSSLSWVTHSFLASLSFSHQAQNFTWKTLRERETYSCHSFQQHEKETKYDKRSLFDDSRGSVRGERRWSNGSLFTESWYRFKGFITNLMTSFFRPFLWLSPVFHWNGLWNDEELRLFQSHSISRFRWCFIFVVSSVFLSDSLPDHHSFSDNNNSILHTREDSHTQEDQRHHQQQLIEKIGLNERLGNRFWYLMCMQIVTEIHFILYMYFSLSLFSYYWTQGWDKDSLIVPSGDKSSMHKRRRGERDYIKDRHALVYCSGWVKSLNTNVCT